MMTESYSAPEFIRRFYQSTDGTRQGAHLPFNFQMITTIDKDSKAETFVEMVSDSLGVIPEGKITNWVVSNKAD